MIYTLYLWDIDYRKNLLWERKQIEKVYIYLEFDNKKKSPMVDIPLKKIT